MHRDDEELLSAVPSQDLETNGIPSAQECALRRRAFEHVRTLLADDLVDDGLRVSPLGPEWSRDLDVHVRSSVPSGRLESAGWLRLSSLLERVGIPGQERWAIVDEGEVIGACDVSREPPPDSVDTVLRRCSERGEVRVREVLELRALMRSGCELPDDEIVRVAADIEASLGADLLPRGAGGPRPVTSTPVQIPRRIQARVGAFRATFRPRVIVALSGVDGSGKSSLSGALTTQLSRAGVPCGSVWTRPGMGPRWIGVLAAAGKRVVKQDSAPGVRAVASGNASTLASRKGLLGWSWTTIVTISFLYDVRAQLRRARGVVIFDRHLLDALATLDFVYQGVDLRFARLMIRRLLPEAALTVYLDVPPDVAVSRKPGDTLGGYAVEQQLIAYAAELDARPDVKIVDARRPANEIAMDALRLLVDPSLWPRYRR